MREVHGEEGSVIREVCSYISQSHSVELPPEVVQKAKHHILDTLAAMVSGSKLKPGVVARHFVKNQAGKREAQVIGSKVVSSAIHAALANGMMAHADETDDSHAKSRTHPGCAIVPAALAMSERVGADGWGLLRGVVAGYDIGCRITQALGVNYLNEGSRSTHCIGGTFGAAAAAASVAGLQDKEVRYVLSYGAQQASGIASVFRDEEHIEKAFVFAGLPARNGVTAAVLAEHGFTGVWDSFSGKNNFFEAFSPGASPRLFSDGLGSRYEILSTNIKKFPVGSPIQAALDALLLLIEKCGFRADDVERVTARLPDYGVAVVDDRDMPNISLQHILAVALLDRDLTFETAHSHERMKDPDVLRMKGRVDLVKDAELSAAQVVRQAIVEVSTKDGSRLREHVVSVRGTPGNPMTTQEVEKKCQELLTPVLGKERSLELMGRIWNLEQAGNIRELRPLLSG
jgi:2-methylcitrate dehydratase PrpD